VPAPAKKLTPSGSPKAFPAGYPIITVPAGNAFGLPLGVSFFAGAGTEARLLSLAFAFEQTVKARRVPEFLPTLRLA